MKARRPRVRDVEATMRAEQRRERGVLGGGEVKSSFSRGVGRKGRSSSLALYGGFWYSGPESFVSWGE